MNLMTVGQVIWVRLMTDEMCDAKVTLAGSPYFEIEFISGSLDGDKICVHENKLTYDHNY